MVGILHLLTHIRNSKIYVPLFFGYVLATTITLAYGFRYGSWRRNSEGGLGVVIFRPPLASRVGWLMFFPIIVSGLIPTAQGANLLCAEVLFWASFAALAFFSGRRELRVNIRHRTYQSGFGFPRFVASGCLDDASIHVEAMAGDRYMIQFRKDRGSKIGFSLGLCGSREKAESLAKAISAELGIKVS